MDDPKNLKSVWTMVERNQANGVTKTFWTRIGVGFVNRDGSITLRLDAHPDQRRRTASARVGSGRSAGRRRRDAGTQA